MTRRIPLAFAILAITILCVAQDPAKKPIGSAQGSLLDAVTGLPISGATLTLTPIRTTDQSATAPATCNSLPDGTFSFNDVQPGRYLLHGEKAGYIDAVYGSQGGPDGIPISIRAEDTVTGLTFKLMPGGLISGTVQNEEGEPFADVNVRAMQYRYVGAARKLVPAAMALTNDRGEYRLHSLLPGSYIVIASTKKTRAIREGETTVPGRYPPTYYPSVTGLVNATTLSLGAGHEMLANFTLTATRGYSIRGKITGMDPKIRATLEAKNRAAAPGSIVAGDVDEFNNFTLTALTPGMYRLRAHGMVSGQTAIGTATVTIDDGDVNDQLVRIEPAREPLHGVVRLMLHQRRPDDLRLRVKLASGAGEESDDDDLPPQAIGASSVRVEKNGSFEGLAAPQPGENAYAAAEAKGTGAEDLYISSVGYNHHPATDDGFVADGGELDIIMSDQAAIITGTVVDRDGEPIPGAEVSIFPDDPGLRRPDLYHVLRADQKGQFEAHGIAPGAYEVVAFNRVEAAALHDPNFLQRYDQQAEKVLVSPKAKYMISIGVAEIQAQDVALAESK